MIRVYTINMKKYKYYHSDYLTPLSSDDVQMTLPTYIPGTW